MVASWMTASWWLLLRWVLTALGKSRNLVVILLTLGKSEKFNCYFIDFGEKGCYFADFEQVKKLIVGLLTLSKSKINL